MIDKCYILALDKRKELWNGLYNECLLREFPTKLFIVGDGSDSSLKYDFVDPIETNPRWAWGEGISGHRHYCAFLSHRRIIMDAVKNNYNTIMLLEDDSYFIEPRFSEHWPEVSQFIDNTEFDILKLGYHAWSYENHLMTGQNLVIEEEYARYGNLDFISIPQCGGLFACIIKKSLFTTILNMAPMAPIDHQLNLYRHKIIKYNTIPMLCYVKSCFSNCEDQFIQRDSL